MTLTMTETVIISQSPFQRCRKKATVINLNGTNSLVVYLYKINLTATKLFLQYAKRNLIHSTFSLYEKPARVESTSIERDIGF